MLDIFIERNHKNNPAEKIISSGLTDYLEPAPTGSSGKGSYVEIFDYGTTLTSSQVTTLAQIQAEGSGTVTRKHKIQLAGATGSFDTGVEITGDSASRFSTSFRRVQYTAEAESSASSLVKIRNLNLRIDAKIKNDTGTGSAGATDSEVVNGVTKQGTTVNFNVTFVDVQGINVTPNSTSAVIAVVDFQDEPNPTSFRVLLYNTSGVRVSGNFTWQCRGT